MGILDDKVAFVTGAASGIGRGAALKFAQEGARVILADIADSAEIVRTIEGAGGAALSLKCDVSDDDSMLHAVADGVAHFGGLHIVFANAGINGVWAPIDDLTPAEWDKTVAVNLRGTYLTLHHTVPHLKAAGGGSVIITSSVNGNRSFGMAGASAYSTTKAGQVALMKMLAIELGFANIRVNAICPGAIETNIGASTTTRNTQGINPRVRIENSPPLRHGAQPDETADVCAFLASDMARHVSGVEIYVDGGQSLLN